MRPRLHLRALVPLLLVASGTSVGVFAGVLAMRQVESEIEEDARQDARLLNEILGDEIESSLRRGEGDAVQAILLRASSDPRLARAVLIDDRGIILASTVLTDVDDPIEQTRFHAFRKGLERAKRSRVAVSRLAEDGRLLASFQPVLLAPDPNTIVPKRIGVLATVHDLGPVRTRARRSIVLRAALAVGPVVAICVIVGVIFHFSISRRVRRLVADTEAIASGDLDRDVAVEGRDELTTVAAAVARMAEQLRDHTRRLRESEERFRQMAENSDAIIWLATPDREELLYINPAFERVFGRSGSGLIEDPRAILAMIHPEDRPLMESMMESPPPGRRELEFRIIRPDGEERWIRSRAFPVSDRDGRVYRVAGIAEDVTERKRNDQRRKLMMDELDHRVRNNLAAVITIFDQTLARSVTREQLKRSFRERILAMARTHDALAQHRWVGIRLREVIRLAVPAVDHERERIALRGEDPMLPPRMATPLGLVIHELATNAMKHGALSVLAGVVEVTGRLEDDGTTIALAWIERGGPTPPVEPRRGFGLELIRGLVVHELQGRLVLRFPADGLECDVLLPLDENAAGGAAGEGRHLHGATAE